MLRIYWQYLRVRLRWVWWVAGMAVLAWGVWEWRALEASFRADRARLLGEAPVEKAEDLPEIASPDHPAFRTARTETQRLDFVPPPLVEGVWDGIGETIRRHFGVAVAIEGGRLAVGSPATYSFGKDSGVVTFYRLEGGRWAQVSHLVPDGIGPNMKFGRCLAWRGDVLVAGSGTGESDRAVFFGRVTVFRRGNAGAWRQEAVLTVPSAGDESQFGEAVAVSGDGKLVAVAAPREVLDGRECGAVHFFERRDGGGWTLRQTMAPPAASGGEMEAFGGRLAAGDGFLVVTATWRRGSGRPDEGVAHVIVPSLGASRDASRDASSEWEVVQTLGPESKALRPWCDVAVDGNRIVICGYEADGNRGRCRLRIYERSEPGGRFALRQAVLVKSPRLSMRWPLRVAMAGDFIAIGMPTRSDLGDYSGAAMLVRRDPATGQWDPEAETLLPSDGHAGARFGYTGVAATPEGGVAVTCPWWGVGDWKPGAVYWFGPAEGATP